MIAADLLARIPDDDPTYLAQVAVCEQERMHPAVAALQAHYDLRYRRAHAHQRKDAA